MADIFISYSREHRPLTEALRSQLEARGYSVWFDASLHPTGSFHEEIKAEIDAAKAVVVVWTAASVRSEYVCKEAARAREAGKLFAMHGPGFDPGTMILPPFNDLHSVEVTNVDAIVNALYHKRIPPSHRPGRDKATSERLNSDDLPPFLGVCTNEDLDPLVQLINRSFTQNLLSNKDYIASAPDHQKYLDSIDLQFRACAANDLHMIAGKEPPSYREVLSQVFKRRKLVGDLGRPVPEIERQLYNAAYSENLAKISEAIPDDKKEPFLKSLIEDAKMRGLDLGIDPKSKAPLLTILTQAGIKKTGFLAFQKLPILTNAVAKFAFSKGLPLWGNALASRGLAAFAGPIGWAATAAWGLHTLAGPANKRVVDPGIDHIIWLRETKRHTSQEGL